MVDTDDFFNRPGRYGAHNIHENRTTPFFHGGIRVFDTTNPFQPEGLTSPQIPDGGHDIHVDENGIMYVADRLQGGLYILIDPDLLPCQPLGREFISLLLMGQSEACNPLQTAARHRSWRTRAQ